MVEQINEYSRLPKSEHWHFNHSKIFELLKIITFMTILHSLIHRIHKS